MELEYLKTQAGGDVVIFVKGEKLPKGEDLLMGLEILNLTGGRELGILYPPEGEGDLKVRIIDLTSKGFISMCGGLTQGLGKIIGETTWLKYPLSTKVLLETDEGMIPLEIILKNRKVVEVITSMAPYLKACLRRGIHLFYQEGLTMVGVGFNREVREFLVLDMDELKEKGFETSSFKEENLPILEGIYQEFLRLMKLPDGYLYGALYQMIDPYTLKVLFPFYPWDGKEMDFSCGTGSVAIALALHKRGLLHIKEGHLHLTLKVGLREGGPITCLKILGDEGGLLNVSFSHQPLQIIEKGSLSMR